MANSGEVLGDDARVGLAEALQNTAVRNVILDAVQLSDALSPSTVEQIGVHLIGIVLSLCAGMANAIAFAKFKVFVSHVSGSSTSIGLRMEDEQPGDVPTPVELLLYFIAGSTLCGLIIPGNTMKVGQAHYEVVLFLVAFMELLCWMHELRFPQVLAAAMGLQNALVTSWSGAVVRTTHMTGAATDLGSSLGRIISRCFRRGCLFGKFSKEDWDQHVADRKKVVLMTCLIISFIGGGVVGAEGYRKLGIHSLLMPAGLTAILGASHLAYSIIKKEQMDEVKATEMMMRRQISSAAMPNEYVENPEKREQHQKFVQSPAMQFIRQISSTRREDQTPVNGDRP